jgi:DNA-binding transcriptional regulator LsrR (DeoR family)
MGKENRRQQTSSGTGAVPAEFDDATVWAAWMYYVDELTQSEIAEIVGVSRVTVIKMLQEARDRGVVSIRINTEIAGRAQLARELAHTFNLDAATVIPDGNDDALVRRLGEAAALVLADAIKEGDIIGVAWGRTVLEAARAISLPGPIDSLTVVQVAGSSTGTSTTAFSPELCSSLLANRLSAHCVNLLTPALLSTAALRDQLLAESSIQKQFSIIRSANRILFGVGDVGPGSTVRQAELLDTDTIDGFCASGAVAAIISRFIGPDGEPMSGAIHDRMIGITLDELKTIPYRLCVAGGRRKITAVLAALRGGYATNLITDASTARSLIEANG